MENLIWKPVVGYEGLYEGSNTGLVKSLGNAITYKSPHLLKISRSGRGGYCRVQLYKNGISEMKSIHRMVAEAFIPNPNNYPVINHKDEDVSNNHVDNLEWCTVSYNYHYSYKKHPKRREMMMAYLVNPETGENISPWSKKGVPHTCNKEVAIVDENWKPIIIYECPAIASKETGVSISNIISACQKNQKRKRRYLREGKIFIFTEN